ncbi:hypothetical protein BDY21DRAFT_198210 [Lineolata rhizophorae]|uniref:Secreted protein n=1 Tax=Lineolata rhizophorae TaxID=578093 RepID=A0A6A6P594_9PEZI|nr:hypothetical protein BDY21DRAFT_198210 [Lineolata rhizophorae]
MRLLPRWVALSGFMGSLFGRSTPDRADCFFRSFTNTRHAVLTGSFSVSRPAPHGSTWTGSGREWWATGGKQLFAGKPRSTMARKAAAGIDLRQLPTTALFLCSYLPHRHLPRRHLRQLP